MTNAAAELLIPEGVAIVARQHLDARTAALLRLRLFISLLRCFRQGDRGAPPVEFRVPIANIHEEWPDDEIELKLPAVAFLPGPGSHSPIGLGEPEACEESLDVFAPNTVLEQTGEYREQIGVEAWAHGKAERRGLVAALKQAFTSAEGSYAIRMRLPDYYDQIATFVLDESLYVDEPDVVRGRRRALLRTTLIVPEVRLVSYPLMIPIVGLYVADRGYCEGDGVTTVLG